MKDDNLKHMNEFGDSSATTDRHGQLCKSECYALNLEQGISTNCIACHTTGRYKRYFTISEVCRLEMGWIAADRAVTGAQLAGQI